MVRRAGGTTLVELLICLALMVILLVAIVQVEMAARDYLSRSNSRLDLQLKLVGLVPRLERDLADASQASFQSASNGFCVATSRDASGIVATDPSGSLLYGQAVGYFLDSAGHLNRLVLPIPPPTTVAPVTTCAQLQKLGCFSRFTSPYQQSCAG